MGFPFAQKMRSFFGWSNPAYEGASRTSPEMGTWVARSLSPDAELLPERDVLNARGREMLRNNGWAAGYAQSRTDSVIGAKLTLIPRPNFVTLKQSAEWADSWQRTVKSLWRDFADDPDCWIDWTRRCTFSQLMVQLYKSFIFNSEMILVMEWRTGPENKGRRTAVNIIHPDLLSNPDDQPDRWDLRGGVQLDARGAPIGYWFRQAHVNDISVGDAPNMKWRYVPRETSWGRRQVIHVYEVEQPGQTRGRPTFAASLLRLRMWDRFEKTALEQQILQAMYSATITSSVAPAEIAKAMGGPSSLGSDESPLEALMGIQSAFHKEGGIRLGGQKVPHLLPGEQLEFKTPGNSAPTLDAFWHKVLLYLSRALPGASFEELSGDYSRTSYSSARASGITPWRFVTGQRLNVAHTVAQGVYACKLEEWMDAGLLPTPANAPSFWDAKAAWTSCKWLGGPRGAIDEEKEQNARMMKRAMGVLTHEDHCAEEGQDGDEVLERLAAEKVKFEVAGLTELMPGADLLTKITVAREQRRATEGQADGTAKAQATLLELRKREVAASELAASHPPAPTTVTIAEGAVQTSISPPKVYFKPTLNFEAPPAPDVHVNMAAAQASAEERAVYEQMLAELRAA